jgi:hypothetical protein
LHQQHAPPELRHDYRHHDVEHDRQNQRIPCTVIEDRPSSSPLGVERIEFLLEPLVGRLASVDRAADGESGARVINPGHGPLSRLSKSPAAAA